MSFLRAIAAVSTLWLVTASCGKPFTIVGSGGGGAGGAGATGGAGTTSSSATSTSSSSSSGGTKLGDACDPSGKDPCDPGLFCSTKDCQSGTCAAVPAAEGQKWSPVCGCDGIVYWNADLAIAADVSFQSSADCNQSKLATCSPTNKTCPTDSGVYCNLHAGGSVITCTPPTGFCTKVPESCDGTTLTGKECFAATGECRSACEMVKAEQLWFTPEPGCLL